MEEIEEGRALSITLKHHTLGALQIINVYYHSGHDQNHERSTLHGKIGRKIRPQHTHTTILTGDFNFVEHNTDRINLTTMNPSGAKDAREAHFFQQTITNPHALTECTQPHHTHKNSTSTAKLDRFYINHHPLDQVDHGFHCTALHWNTDASNHRPIGLTKTITTKKNYTTIPTHHIHHPEWAIKVQRQYQELLSQNTIHNSLQKNRPTTYTHPLLRLKLYKEAMWLASQQMQEEDIQQPTQKPSHPN